MFSDPGEDFVGLFSLHRPFWETGPQFVGERLQAQPDALVGYQLRGGIVHQKAMLDALHTRCNGLLDRFGREGMYSNVRAPVLGGFHGGPKLRLGKGDHIDRAEWR